jgi:pimeloyl-ACP methyl ester carboxylesterase
MDPVRELPYWPAAKALHIEAGQMAASDYVPTYPNLTLASEGASTDAVHLLHRKRAVGFTGFYRLVNGEREWTNTPHDELGRVTMTTLVVCGEEDRDNGSAQKLADILPEARYVEVPGPHMSSVTKPDLGGGVRRVAGHGLIDWSAGSWRAGRRRESTRRA